MKEHCQILKSMYCLNLGLTRQCLNCSLNRLLYITQKIVMALNDRHLSSDSLNSNDNSLRIIVFVSLFDLILYVPSTIFQLNRDGSSWVEPVLS